MLSSNPYFGVLQCVAACCSVSVASPQLMISSNPYFGVLQRVAAVAACCSVLQRINSLSTTHQTLVERGAHMGEGIPLFGFL